MLDKIAIALISPLGTALALQLLVVLLILASKRVLAFLLLVLSIVWLYAWSTPMGAHWLSHRLDAEFAPLEFQRIPRTDAIVVLGGGMHSTGWPQRFNQPVELSDAADRVWYAARLYKAGKAPLIIASGGGRAVEPEADAMALFLDDFGVPPEAVLKEPFSLNTRENAAFTAQLAEPHGIKRILLVTSALHMARATELFEAQGFDVISAPTDYQSSHFAYGYQWLPNAGALEFSGRVLKEFVAKKTVSRRK